MRMNMSTADRHANNRQDPLRQTGAQGLRAAHSSRLLSPRMLDSLKNLELVARAMVEGSLTGLHRSPYHGFSSEFSEYRKYCPGDAVKHVDWVAYAKTDRYYVKQYEDETNTRAYIVLDRSGSMALGAAKNHKLTTPVTSRRPFSISCSAKGCGRFVHLHRPHRVLLPRQNIADAHAESVGAPRKPRPHRPLTGRSLLSPYRRRGPPAFDRADLFRLS